MGIKDLYKVILHVDPNIIKTVYIHNLAGYIIAVDISIFLYKFIRSSGDQWKSTFLLFLSILKKNKIKPICIFDGKSQPIEKKEEQDRRRAETGKAVTRVQDAKNLLQLLKKKYLPFDKTLDPEIVEQARSIIRVKRGFIDTTNYNDCFDICDTLGVLIEKLERQTAPITYDHSEEAFKIVEMMGLCAIRAEGEAEGLCSYLAILGHVDAVLTEDTDVLAYGTPKFFAFKNYKLNEGKFVYIDLDLLLNRFNMTVERFRDLCILLSCDYNDRVKGFPPTGRKYKKATPVGWAGALAFMDAHSSLEEVEPFLENPERLIYPRCRELFSIPKGFVPPKIPLNSPPNAKALEELIRSEELSITVDSILNTFKPIEVIYEDGILSGNSSSDDFEVDAITPTKKKKRQRDERKNMECSSSSSSECKIYTRFIGKCEHKILDKPKDITFNIVFNSESLLQEHAHAEYISLYDTINIFLSTSKNKNYKLLNLKFKGHIHHTDVSNPVYIS